MSLSNPDFASLTVPDWVKYIAQDSDGSWWGYSVEPLQNHRGWYENELGDNVQLIQADKSEAKHLWKESLIKL